MSEVFKPVEITALRRNPEWQALSGRENRMPNQFGGIGDNGDGTPELFDINHLDQDEIDQLVERQATFPFMTGEGIKYNPILVNPAPEKAVFIAEKNLLP